MLALQHIPALLGALVPVKPLGPIRTLYSNSPRIVALSPTVRVPRIVPIYIYLLFKYIPVLLGALLVANLVLDRNYLLS